MKKNCDEIMDLFLELDKNQRLPLKVTLHLLFCKKCRTEVRLFTLAEKTCSQPLKVPLADNDAIIDMLMTKINPNYSKDGKIAHISMTKWIVSGITMILAMLMFLVLRPYVASTTLDISFCILFTCVISAYCAIFVGSNMDFFIKKIETMKDIQSNIHIHIPGLN